MDKKWTEDKDPAYCLSGKDRFSDAAAPDVVDPHVFKCHLDRMWMAFGKDFSGIYLIHLSDAAGKAEWNEGGWTSKSTDANPYWALAKNVPSKAL